MFCDDVEGEALSQLFHASHPLLRLTYNKSAELHCVKVAADDAAPPPPTLVAWTSPDDAVTVDVQLVHSHPLWGHILYPAAKSLATLLWNHRTVLVEGKSVLELGAGGGLPGLVAAKAGATTVVSSDFPDSDLLINLEGNGKRNDIPSTTSFFVKGHTWGRSVTSLLDTLPPPSHQFDIVLLSDLVFNHNQHEALLQTCERCLKPSLSPPPTPPTLNLPLAFCFFSHHRPHLIDADLSFFTLAQSRGWTCHNIIQDQQAGPAFPDDEEKYGHSDIRSTVHGYVMYWSPNKRKQN